MLTLFEMAAFPVLVVVLLATGASSAQTSNTPSSAPKNTTHCATAPCQNGATCRDLANGYNCTCPAGFTGKLCQTNEDDCSPNLCQNGATCQDLVNGFHCVCPSGFTGKLCQTCKQFKSNLPGGVPGVVISILGGKLRGNARSHRYSKGAINIINNQISVYRRKNGACACGKPSCECQAGKGKESATNVPLSAEMILRNAVEMEDSPSNVQTLDDNEAIYESEVRAENTSTVAGMADSDKTLFLQTREKLKALQEKVREFLKRAKTDQK